MMPADNTPSCPDCEHGPQAEPTLSRTPTGLLEGSAPTMRRRDFIRAVGTTATLAAVGGLTPLQRARAARAEKQAAAEQMVFELFATMDGDQRKKLVLPWDHKVANQPRPARLMTGNGPVGKSVIGLEYTKKQVEILDRIFRAISNGDEGYKRLSRNGKFDNSGDFESIGALTYGEPGEGKKFSLVFTGHHLTVRCDGNSEEATAFGGPLYYGHSPSGFAATNVFYNQTKAAQDLFGSLSAEQRKAGLIEDKPWHDEHGTIKPPKPTDRPPGVAIKDMSQDQKELVERVMRELVAPYRKEDGDEVLEIIKANGGMEKICLAFYKDKEAGKEPWSYWRLEGPGFVWSFRALPHIHTFVNVSSKLS